MAAVFLGKWLMQLTRPCVFDEAIGKAAPARQDTHRGSKIDEMHGARFLEWLLPLLVQVLVAGPLHHPPLLTSQNMTSTTKSWVGQWE